MNNGKGIESAMRVYQRYDSIQSVSSISDGNSANSALCIEFSCNYLIECNRVYGG